MKARKKRASLGSKDWMEGHTRGVTVRWKECDDGDDMSSPPYQYLRINLINLNKIALIGDNLNLHLAIVLAA